MKKVFVVLAACSMVFASTNAGAQTLKDVLKSASSAAAQSASSSVSSAVSDVISDYQILIGFIRWQIVPKYALHINSVLFVGEDDIA